MAGAAWYRYGSVSVVLGSPVVIGVATAFLSQVHIGDAFTLDGSKFYEIASIQDDTHLTLHDNFGEASASNTTYGILRNFSTTTNAVLAAQLTALLASWQAREDEFRVWQHGVVTGGALDANGTGAVFTAGLVSNTTGGAGYYPMADATGVRVWLKCPAALVGTTETGPGADHTFTVGPLTARRTVGDIQCTIDAQSATAGAFSVVQNGDGTTSAKYAYSRFKNNDANGQSFIVGHYGSDNFLVRDGKAGVDRITITPAGGITFNGYLTGNLLLGTTDTAGMGGGTGIKVSHGTAPVITLEKTGSGAHTYLQYVTSDGSFRIWDSTNSIERVMLSAAGNFLIGTTQDDTYGKLQVKGQIIARSGISATDARISLSPIAGATPRVALYAYNGNDTAPVPLVLQEGGSTVLVGTTTDNGSGAKLQVNGGMSMPNLGSITVGTAWGTGRIDFYNGASTFGSWGASGLTTQVPLVANYGATLTGGNVLVGTATDNGSGAKLQVAGNISFSPVLSSSATGGTAALPTNPVGFFNIYLNGSAYRVPYYYAY